MKYYTATELLKLSPEEREKYIAQFPIQENTFLDVYLEEDDDEVYLCATEKQIRKSSHPAKRISDQS